MFNCLKTLLLTRFVDITKHPEGLLHIQISHAQAPCSLLTGRVATTQQQQTQRIIHHFLRGVPTRALCIQGSISVNRYCIFELSLPGFVF